MPIFQKSVINDAKQDETLVAARFAKYLEFKAKAEAIRGFKEEEYQDGFLKDIFENCLGYTMKTTNPDSYNLSREKKNETDGKKADGAIYLNGEVVGVIELKDYKTRNLDAVEAQAFNYHNSHANSKYIVISNFDELRFYIDKKTAYEKFGLFGLTYEEFRRLHLLLSFESLKDGLPIELKRKSLAFEAEITNALYKDYKTLRAVLFEDLCAKNESVDKITLIKATQKLIDRLIFIFFAEDTGLIPSNSIAKIIEIYNKNWEYNPLYHYYKIYFDAIDQGNERAGIRLGYNGELFKKDSFLDSLTISDATLNSFALKISNYDFKSDVSVNILGHIFENSLSELEELKAQIEGGEFNVKKSKRKKDGVFYTPEYITHYIVQNTLGKLCDEYKSKRKMDTKEELDAYRAWLLNLKILDPACGSGAFLNQALEFLINEHKSLSAMYHEVASKNKKSVTLLDLDYQDSHILQNNLYGVDINEEAVEIAKLSLWLRTAKEGEKLVSLSDKIKLGNSLIDDKSISESAFVWQEEFSDVFAQGGFDVIVGNPPYIRVQGLKANYEKEAAYYEQNFESARANYDIYVLFMEKSFGVLKRGGLLSFILPHKFLVSEFGYAIREFLAKNRALKELLHFGSNMVFDEASTYTAITTLSHGNEELRFAHIRPDELDKPIAFDSISYHKLSGDKWGLANDKTNALLEKLNSQPLRVKDVFKKIFVGLQTSADDIYLIDGAQNGNVVRGYSKSLERAVEIEAGLTKPMLKGEDIARYATLSNRYFVIFPYIITDGKAEPMSEEYIKKSFPKGYEYLKANEAGLRGRENGKFDNPKEWFLFSRQQGISGVEQEKIITPDIAFGSSMTLDNEGFYHGTTLYSFIKSDDYKEDYKFYLAILNSSLMWFFIQQTSTELRGGYFRFKTKYLEPFPLPKLENIDDQKPFVEKVDLILELNCELSNAKADFNDYAKHILKISKLPQKLSGIEKLDFDEFLTELKKQKVNTNDINIFKSLKAMFEEIKAKKSTIEAMDRELDRMVLKLYGVDAADVLG